MASGNDDFYHRLFDPGHFIWDPQSHGPTQYANEDQFQRLFSGMSAQQAPQVQGTQLQMGNDPFRAAQLQQMRQLQGIASGQQQGAGELAAQRQIQNAMAAQQAQARMARGGNAALAARNAANQTAALGLSGVGMGQQAAMQDQQAAQGQLANVGAVGRQGDFGVANANAGFAQNANLANQQGQLAMNQLNSGNYLQLLNQLNQRDMNKYNSDLGIGAAQNQADAAKTGGLLAGIGAIFSDERLKEKVTDAGDEIDEMLDALTPKSGVYKDEKFGKGEWNWVMAQDMEKTKAGSRVIKETPDGKTLDGGKTISTLLASVARLNKRVRNIEGR
jgi:hypothetical protein